MCPPPDPVARAATSRGEPPARGHVPPPPGVGPHMEPTPPLVAAADRTVVTHRRRASHRAAEPHELLPTLRLPPVEARALRRQVAAEAGPEAGLPIDGGEVEAAEAAPPVRVRAMPGPARLHRPPLPMPDVLRQGPRTAPRRAAEEGVEIDTRAPSVPEEVTPIDTASLVLEVAESLAASTSTSSPATPSAASAVAVMPGPEFSSDPDSSDPEFFARPGFSVPAVETATAVGFTAPQPTPILDPPARTAEPSTIAPRRRRAPWVVGLTVAAAAGIVGALWAFAPTPQAATASLGLLREQVPVAHAEPSRALAMPSAPPPIQVAPPLPLEPLPTAAPEPPAPPPTMLALATPTEPEAPPEPEASLIVEPDAPTPSAAAKPKPKPKSKAQRRKAKPASTPMKASSKVAAPAPAPDATALLREAEKAFAEGRHGTALRNAQRSLAARNDPRAARIVVLSACKLGREDVARANFERLPLGQRRGVRNACKDAGVRVGS